VRRTIPDDMIALREVIAFCARHVPYYRDHHWAERVRAGKAVSFVEIPYTLDSDVKDNAEAFYVDDVPLEHGPVAEKYTSGISGVSLKVRKTALHYQINARQNFVLKRGWNFSKHLIRVSTDQATKEFPKGSVQVRHRGTKQNHVIRSFESQEIAGLVERSGATLIASRPTVVQGALQEEGYDFSRLKLVATVGESLSQQFKQTLQRYPGLSHCDVYGAVETGIIGATCHHCGTYHLAHDHLFIQVLNGAAEPVPAGETGRIAVTPLFNYAMPLLKYMLGDLVEVATKEDCPLGRGGFKSIVGRERHQFLLSNGARITPNIPTVVLMDLGIKQYRLVQTDLKRVELYYVTYEAGARLSDEIVRNLISQNIAPDVVGVGIKKEVIAPSPAGKFLMHESLLQKAA
jgi:phenylacetate-CoA ligase